MGIPSPQTKRVIRSRIWLPPALASLVFALLSLALLPYPGLQDDEVIFTIPISIKGSAFFSAHLFGHAPPLMLVSYAGALKTWIYEPILRIAAPSVWSVRLPMVLAGIATIWLAWEWVRRIAGNRAAAFTVSLLATDSMFILTNTFDWGPVALQHLLLLGGLLSLQIWLALDPVSRQHKWLAIAFFLWGLGLWDKALMIWPLTGLVVAAVFVYPGELWRSLRPRIAAVAVGALIVGALPLVWFNIESRGQTATANTRISLAQIPHNSVVLAQTLNGSALRDYIAAAGPGPILREPDTFVGHLSVGLRKIIGRQKTNLTIPALILSLICLVFLLRAPSRRVLIFILIAGTATWLQMAANENTGGSAHHVILMWPLPCVFVGIALAHAAERLPRASYLIALLIAVFACANFTNTNEYLATLIQNGAAGGWTDASYRLTGEVSRYKSGRIGAVDWGYFNILRMRYGAGLQIVPVNEYVATPASAGNRSKLLSLMDSPDMVFIRHTDPNEIFPGVNENLRAIALAAGYSEEILRVVHDNEGREVFEIFRFVKT